jgi:PAS domain S-box-containing protein
MEPDKMDRCAVRRKPHGTHGSSGIERLEMELLEAREAAERSERARLECEERLRLVLDGSNDGFWDWDIPSGRININRRWERMLGYSIDEIEHNMNTWDRLVHPDDLPFLTHTRTRHFEGETPFYEAEYRTLTKSGEWKWILDRGKVVKCDIDGKPLMLAGTYTDISERKHAQEELAAKQMQLETLNQSLQKRIEEAVAELRQKDQVLISQGRQAAMGEMIGNIAHQWRQPLNALAMLITNLQFAQRDNELTVEYLNDSAASANRLIQKMSTTINDFRNFFNPDKEVVSFSALRQIRNAVELVEAAYKKNGISIIIDAVNDSQLKGFPNEYSQVLLNLLSNARDAILESESVPGQITIMLKKQGDKGVVTVQDNGGGIPEAIHDKIFEPYFSTKKMGTGIGLYMSKMIIERNMHGAITARTTETGTEFSVFTPLGEVTE